MHGERTKVTKRFAAAVSIATLLTTTASFAQTFNICVGEYWEPKHNLCQSYDIYIYCLMGDPTRLNNAAMNACKQAGASGKFTQSTLRDVPGNKCGYANIRIYCQ
jgi:hypothetical protein